MLNAALTYLNTLLVDTGYIQQTNEIVVLVRRDNEQFPAYYCGGGEYKRVSDFDGTQGISYWRLRSEPTDSDIAAVALVESLARRTYPLKLVVAVMREHLGDQDDAYAEDRLSLAIKKQFKDREKSLRQELGANNAELLFRGVTTNSDTVAGAELINIPVRLKSRALFMSIDIDLVIDYQGSCISDFCSTNITKPTITGSGSATGNTITFSTADADATGRKLYRSVSINGPFGLIADVDDDVNSYNDTAVSPLDIYFYKLTDYNATSRATSDVIAVASIAPITIYNDKATPDILLSEITEDTTLPNMTVVVHSALGSSQSLSVAVPPDGSTLHVHLEDSNGDDASIPVGTTTYNENIDHIFVPLGNIAITDSVDSFISAQFLIGQTPRTTVKDRDANTLTTDSFTKVGTNGLTITIDESTAIAAADFSQADNYTAFLGNETAKAAPVRMPAQPLGGTPLFDGSLDYLYNLGRFSDELINPPGRTKVKKLADFLTLHADNPRPDGGFERFQPVTVTLSSIVYDCYVDWWQELFIVPPQESVQVIGLGTDAQQQYLLAITIHPMLRLTRKEEIDLLYWYPATSLAAASRIYTTTGNNSFRTCTVITGTTNIITAREQTRFGPQTTLAYNSISNLGPPMLVCFLEEIMNEDLNLI